MELGLQNPLNSVINNLGLSNMQQNSGAESSSLNSLFGGSQAQSLMLPLPGNQQTQFNQMFRNVLQLFKTFVGTMQELGLVKSPETAAADGAEGTGETEEQNPILGMLSNLFGPVKDVLGSLGESITSFFGNAISNPKSLLNPIKNLFKKAKGLFSGKSSLLTSAFKLIKGLF